MKNSNESSAAVTDSHSLYASVIDATSANSPPAADIKSIMRSSKNEQLMEERDQISRSKKHLYTW